MHNLRLSSHSSSLKTDVQKKINPTKLRAEGGLWQLHGKVIHAMKQSYTRYSELHELLSGDIFYQGSLTLPAQMQVNGRLVAACCPLREAHVVFSPPSNHCLMKLLMQFMRLQTDRVIDSCLRSCLRNRASQSGLSELWIEVGADVG